MRRARSSLRGRSAIIPSILAITARATRRPRRATPAPIHRERASYGGPQNDGQPYLFGLGVLDGLFLSPAWSPQLATAIPETSAPRSAAATSAPAIKPFILPGSAFTSPIPPPPCW